MRRDRRAGCEVGRNGQSGGGQAARRKRERGRADRMEPRQACQLQAAELGRFHRHAAAQRGRQTPQARVARAVLGRSQPPDSLTSGARFREPIHSVSGACRLADRRRTAAAFGWGGSKYFVYFWNLERNNFTFRPPLLDLSETLYSVAPGRRSSSRRAFTTGDRAHVFSIETSGNYCPSRRLARRPGDRRRRGADLSDHLLSVPRPSTPPICSRSRSSATSTRAS